MVSCTLTCWSSLQASFEGPEHLLRGSTASVWALPRLAQPMGVQQVLWSWHKAALGSTVPHRVPVRLHHIHGLLYCRARAASGEPVWGGTICCCSRRCYWWGMQFVMNGTTMLVECCCLICTAHIRHVGVCSPTAMLPTCCKWRVWRGFR